MTNRELMSGIGNTSQLEKVVLTALKNDGDVAVCSVTLEGRLLTDEVRFEREERSREKFLADLAVGKSQESERFKSTRGDFENAREALFQSRATKTNRCRQ